MNTLKILKNTSYHTFKSSEAVQLYLFFGPNLAAEGLFEFYFPGRLDLGIPSALEGSSED